MDAVRAISLIVHFGGVVMLVSALLLVAVAPSRCGAARWVLVGAGLMALTGMSLIVARSSLDLPVDGLKLGVKTAVLIAVVVCAIRLRSIVTNIDDENRRGPVALCAAIGALVVGNIAIAFGWN